MKTVSITLKKEEIEKDSHEHVYYACRYGHIEIIKYLVSINAPIDKNTISYAARGGHIEVVKYLVSINAPINDTAIKFAARSGNLDLVKYLVSVNAQIDLCALSYASEYGHTEVVKYLVSINAPIGCAIRFASYNKHHKIVKYLLWHDGAPKDIDVNLFVKELRLEYEPILSEFIGPDLSGLIFDYLVKNNYMFLNELEILEIT